MGIAVAWDFEVCATRDVLYQPLPQRMYVAMSSRTRDSSLRTTCSKGLPMPDMVLPLGEPRCRRNSESRALASC